MIKLPSINSGQALRHFGAAQCRRAQGAGQVVFILELLVRLGENRLGCAQAIRFIIKGQGKGEVDMEEKEIGHISHYFDHISVAAIEVTDDTIKVGETLHFKGHTTDFEMQVESLQIEHESISEAKAGDSIGIKVPEKVRIGDKVFKVISE